jgi:NAD(P)-dependent dehydrogenase (short-subunit alcohol dehydrogenase family)
MTTEAAMAMLAPALCGDGGGRPLDGMVALVSGGGRGIGRLLGARLAGAGAAVGLIARSGDELAAAAGEIHRAGGRSEPRRRVRPDAAGP